MTKKKVIKSMNLPVHKTSSQTALLARVNACIFCVQRDALMETTLSVKREVLSKRCLLISTALFVQVTCSKYKGEGEAQFQKGARRNTRV